MVVTANNVIQLWPYNSLDSAIFTESSPSSDEDNDSDPDSDESRQELRPWEEWYAFVQELDSSDVTKKSSMCSPFSNNNTTYASRA